jgi:hypothetical protein
VKLALLLPACRKIAEVFEELFVCRLDLEMQNFVYIDYLADAFRPSLNLTDRTSGDGSREYCCERNSNGQEN